MKREQFWSLFFLLLVLIILFFYCFCWHKGGEDKSGVKKPGADTKATLASPLTGSLHRLILKQTQYEKIRGNGADKAKKLIFVFYLDDAFTDYPTLAAFASKNNHFTWYKDSVMLSPEGGNGYFPLPRFCSGKAGTFYLKRKRQVPRGVY